MAKEIKVAVSPLTNVIYAGTTIKGGRAWGAGKQDVTIDALVAVAQHVLKFGEPVVISKDSSMKTQTSSASLLAVLAHALSPGMVLDEQTYDGMIAIIQQVKASLQQDASQVKK